MGGIRNWREARKRKLAQALQAKLSEGARDERGAVAIVFAFAVIVLVPLVLGLFDVYTASAQRGRLQDALDAAALYAARTDSVDNGEIDALGKKALMANLKLLRGATLVSAQFSLTENNTKIVGTATVQPLALAPWFWAHPPVTVGADVVRNSKNLEVALVLDVTGSMSGGKIADLRSAAQDLVELVVKEQQAPYYSKVAVVPWSMGVNVGAYASQVRGPVTGVRSITNVTWKAGAKSIAGITRDNPAVLSTSGNHGFSNGDTVYVTGVKGMTQVNNKIFTISNASGNTFRLSGISSSKYNKYKSGGTVTKCIVSTCDLVVTTSANHNYAGGDYVYIRNVSGISSVNEKAYAIENATSTTFSLPDTELASGTYSAGGTSYCTKYGCEYLRFKNPSGTIKYYKVSSCVSERTGSDQYSDAAPSTTYVGFNYPAVGGVLGTDVSGDGNPCLEDQIIPLSTNKQGVKNAIAALQATGSTAGQTGVAWGWYMISPNFGSLWPSASRPASYAAKDTLKVVVLMTDGALNTAYCNGVIAQDSPNGSGSVNDHINCDATNGATFNQSKTLCQNMKAAGVVVYTVGFQITGDTTAEQLMTDCATDAKHKYLPTSGTGLSEAFRAIGADINNLRLSK